MARRTSNLTYAFSNHKLLFPSLQKVSIKKDELISDLSA